jgi:hypothetical protein
MHLALLGLQKETWYQLDRDPKAGLDVVAMGMRKSMLKPELKPSNPTKH